MTVLVTGGAGFVGLNLVETLLSRGHAVTIFGREELPAPAAIAFAALPGRLTTVQGDVRDAEALHALFTAGQFDTVFPFAAITSGPAREAENPESVLQVNLLGMLATLRAARDAGVRRVIVPSSTAVYGESFHHYPLMREGDTPCVPASLYGVTKYAVERMGLRMGELWDMDLIAARISAVFGPWERDTGVRDTIGPHTRIAQAALRGEAMVLPERVPLYHWVYARDLADGLVHLMTLKNPPHRVFNVCSGLNWGPEILDWCRALQGAFPAFRWSQGPNPTIAFTDPRDRAPLDISRICATGWAPKFPPEKAYPDYLAWLGVHQAAIAA
jgi:nucleoside-diphosphate-sugar epimerase